MRRHDRHNYTSKSVLLIEGAYSVKVWLYCGELGVKHIGESLGCRVSGHIVWSINNLCYEQHLQIGLCAWLENKDHNVATYCFTHHC